ncbi:unnamed protein product, partial [Hapterophycus canaliculatus]
MESLGIVPGLPYYHWAIKGAANTSGGRRRGGGADGDAAAAAAEAVPAHGWGAMRDIAAEMSEKGVVPNQNSYRLVEQMKPRLPADGTGGSGAEEAERVLALLRGIEGAPEPAPLPPPPPPPPRMARATKAGEEAAGAAASTETAESSEEEAKKARDTKTKAKAKSRGSSSSSSASSSSPRSSGKGGAGNVLGSVQACNKTLRKLSTKGNGTKAIALIASMRKAGVALTDRSYTSAMNACRRGGQWREVLALLKSACSDPGVTVNEFHFAAAVKTCANGQQWDRQIPALLADMESRGISASTDLYNWAIKAASSRDMGGPARSILAREGGWRSPDQDGSDAGDPSSESTGAGSDAGAESRGRSGAPPSCGSEAATGLLRHMLDSGVPPNPITYTLVLSACRRDGEPERALAVLRGMQEVVAAVAAREKEEEEEEEQEKEREERHQHGHGQEKEAVVEEEEGGASAAEGEGDDGSDGGAAADASSASSPQPWRRRRERRMGAGPPNAIHYASVMAAFAEYPGGWKNNLALMKEMEEAGIAPNVYAYNATISACGWEGRWAEAVAVFRRMRKKGVAPDEVS